MCSIISTPEKLIMAAHVWRVLGYKTVYKIEFKKPGWPMPLRDLTQSKYGDFDREIHILIKNGDGWACLKDEHN